MKKVITLKQKKNKKSKKNRKSRKGGKKNCGCGNEVTWNNIFKGGSHELGPTINSYPLNDQKDYIFPKSSSLHSGGKRKRVSKRKTKKIPLKVIKGGTGTYPLTLPSYDNAFLNVPSTKGMVQVANMLVEKHVPETAPYSHLNVETNQYPMV